jgi:rhamnopyranosyl-N-acetylglucosaminyl-diphospho-decaprenol beta-1,3/1,4-galactofuranosyltransferase
MMNYAAIIVTRNSKQRIGKLLTALQLQSLRPEKIIIVDNASEDSTVSFCKNLGLHNLDIIQNAENLGGAGGFNIGLHYFFGTGIRYAWTFDDDAIPLTRDGSMRLIQFMEQHSLKAAGPLVLDPENEGKTAFKYKTPVGPSTDVGQISEYEIIWDDVKFFNGVMLDRSVISECGLPRAELFIRGDEAEYLARVRKAGCRMATLTEVHVSHPSSVNEYFTFFNRKIWYCKSRSKRYFTYRNRALLHSERGHLSKIGREWIMHMAFNLLNTKDYQALIDCCRGYWDGALKKTETRNAKRYKKLCGKRS